MGRQASAEAAQMGHDSDLRELPDPESFAPGPRPPGSRHASEHSRYASAALRPQPAAPARARQLTRDYLARWNLRALTADAEAIASEIVTNAVNAVPPGSTGLTIIYTIHASPTALHIHVWDIGPGHPARADADPDAETGRGLTIIDALTASNWGWWPTPASGGKVVWAALPAPAAQQDGAQDIAC